MNTNVLNIYGVDLGGGSFHVSINNQPGESYSLEEFKALDWYVGPGNLYTENTTFYPRPLKKTASLAQAMTYEEVCKFLDDCEDNKVKVFQLPARNTWKHVRNFVDKVQQRDPSVADYLDKDLSKLKLDKNGKMKNDSIEAMIIAWVGTSHPEKVSRLYDVRDPDIAWDKTFNIKHQIIQQSNQRLNSQRANKHYDCADFSTLRDLFPQIEKIAMASNHPGAVALREMGAIPYERAKKPSSKFGYAPGDLKTHAISPIFKATYACSVGKDGKPFPFGRQMLRMVLGGSGFRFRSGVAGAQIRYDVARDFRKSYYPKIGLPILENKNEKYKMLSPDPANPYFKARKECHKKLDQATAFLQQTYKSLLE
jgi:hypothetical protein|tara:strand:- start:388 stop:1488 length:1101 start_codon:yes stop_codon:yes gene_type:complete